MSKIFWEELDTNLMHSSVKLTNFPKKMLQIYLSKMRGAFCPIYFKKLGMVVWKSVLVMISVLFKIFFFLNILLQTIGMTGNWLQ